MFYRDTICHLQGQINFLKCKTRILEKDIEILAKTADKILKELIQIKEQK